MARRSSKTGKAASATRRAWPYMLLAWERWQALSDEEKEKYKERARDLAAKGKVLADDVRAQIETQARDGKKRRRRS